MKNTQPKRNIRKEIKYQFLEFRHVLKEQLMLLQLLTKKNAQRKNEGNKHLVIAMVDGSSYHGGMCDRFKGIISLYAFCKQRNLPFRIKYTHPFRLEEFLESATYNWLLKEREYTDNPRNIQILYMRGEYLARRLFSMKIKKQVHYYGNRDILNLILEQNTPYDWGTLFRELFKPGPELQKQLNQLHQTIGSPYCAAVFRFQNLLGDFKEYHFKALSDEAEKKKLIDKCLNAIQELTSEQDNTKILVTSDSITFLKEASKLKNVVIIPGKLIHIDGQREIKPEEKHELFMKSFLDFYMLAEATHIYSIRTPEMYASQFPQYAAKVHNIPFERIMIS